MTNDTGVVARRGRRTRAQIDTVKAAIFEVVARDNPMTVRQIFYRLVAAGKIGKSEAEYKTTVCRLLTEMRRSGELPYSWIADNTRWMRKPTTHSSLELALERTLETYRRSVWDSQDAYVEIWLEKDALAGVVLPITAQWDVPLMVTRGYPSLSYLYGAAEMIKDQDRPTYLYYFGDHDPSGLDITRATEHGIREMAPDAEIHFERVAVTDDQIHILDLPTRPTKTTDTRSKGFEGGSVEVDAIEPAILRRLVGSCITKHIDHGEYDRLKVVEQAEKHTLASIIRHSFHENGEDDPLYDVFIDEFLDDLEEEQEEETEPQ